MFINFDDSISALSSFEHPIAKYVFIYQSYTIDCHPSRPTPDVHRRQNAGELKLALQVFRESRRCRAHNDFDEHCVWADAYE